MRYIQLEIILFYVAQILLIKYSKIYVQPE